jgi:hypothetical protein
MSNDQLQYLKYGTLLEDLEDGMQPRNVADSADYGERIEALSAGMQTRRLTPDVSLPVPSVPTAPLGSRRTNNLMR